MRFLALGDSYTIGEGVDSAGRWPVQLAAALRAKKLNIADPEIIARTGWTTDELASADRRRRTARTVRARDIADRREQPVSRTRCRPVPHRAQIASCSGRWIRRRQGVASGHALDSRLGRDAVRQRPRRREDRFGNRSLQRDRPRRSARGWRALGRRDRRVTRVAHGMGRQQGRTASHSRAVRALGRAFNGRRVRRTEEIDSRRNCATGYISEPFSAMEECVHVEIEYCTA